MNVVQCQRWVAGLAHHPVAPFAGVSALLAALGLAECTIMQLLADGVDPGRTGLWALGTLVPLGVATLGLAQFPLSRKRPVEIGMIGAALLMLLVTLDVLLFPAESAADWLARARSKLPGIMAFIAAGCAVRLAVVTAQPALFPAPGLSTSDRLAVQAANVLCGAGNYVEVMNDSGRSILIRSTLEQIAKSAEGASFVRLHRSRLVRRSAIIGWHHDRSGLRSAILKDGITVPIGRAYRRVAYIVRDSDR